MKKFLLCTMLASASALAHGGALTLQADSLACNSREALRDLLSYRDNQEGHLFKAELIGPKARCTLLEKGEQLVAVETDPSAGVAIVRRLNSSVKFYTPMDGPK